MLFSEALKKNNDFRRLYAKGKSAASSFLVMYCRKNGSNRNRIGYTVGTKVGKAVVRNRIRRRLREIYRLHEEDFQRGYDIIVVARVRSKYASYGELEASFSHLAEKLDILRREK